MPLASASPASYTEVFLPSPPAGWTTYRSPDSGTRIVLAPRRLDHFQANLVVATTARPPDDDLDGWLTRTDDMLARRLSCYQTLDQEPVRVGSWSGVRRLACHVHPDAGSLTIEQWILVDRKRAVVLTASAATLEYDELADVFAELVAGVR
jgi:hypothetical protein